MATTLKSLLEKEAPETLKEPKRETFNTTQNYQKALQKFKAHGHWATPSPYLQQWKKDVYKQGLTEKKRSVIFNTLRNVGKSWKNLPANLKQKY